MEAMLSKCWESAFLNSPSVVLEWKKGLLRKNLNQTFYYAEPYLYKLLGPNIVRMREITDQPDGAYLVLASSILFRVLFHQAIILTSEFLAITPR